MKKRIAFLVHVWYEDVFLDKIFPKISQHNKKADFYFNFVKSNVSHKCIELIQETFDNYVITYSENPGRDIRGYMNVLSCIYSSGKEYENYLFIHTKTNVDNYGVWCLDNLLQSIVGTPETFDSVIDVLSSEEEVGMIGSRAMIAQGFYTQEEQRKALDICKRLGLKTDKVIFVAGTMFAVKSSVIDTYLKAPGVIESFCQDFYENGEKHSGWHHAWERMFGMLVYDSGKIITQFNP